MASLVSFRSNGKNSRYVEEWERPLSTCSRGNVNGFKLGLSFPSGVDRYDEANKARDYTLSLDEADISKVLKVVFGDIGQSLVSDLYGDKEHDRLGEPVLNRLGIYLQTYRIPAKGFSAFQTHYHCRAVNKVHAIKQFERVLKGEELDPNKIEVQTEDGSGWLQVEGG